MESSEEQQRNRIDLPRSLSGSGLEEFFGDISLNTNSNITYLITEEVQIKSKGEENQLTCGLKEKYARDVKGNIRQGENPLNIAQFSLERDDSFKAYDALVFNLVPGYDLNEEPNKSILQIVDSLRAVVDDYFS